METATQATRLYRVGNSRKRYTFEQATKRAGDIFRQTGNVVCIVDAPTRTPRAILSPAILATVRVVEGFRGNFQVDWRDEEQGAGFHYWFTLHNPKPGESLLEPGAIYKTPLAKSGEPGHFETRILDGEKRRNRAIATLVAAEVTARDLVRKARDEANEKKRQAREEQARATAIHRIKEHGPQTLAALRSLVQWLDESGLSHTAAGGVGAFQYGRTEYGPVTEARAAIAAAEGKADSNQGVAP